MFADARRRGKSRVAGPFSTIVQPRGPAEVDDDDATLRDENVARVQVPMGDAAPRERQARFHEAGERPDRAGLVEGAHRLEPGHRVADALRGAGRPDRAIARRTQEQPLPKEAWRRRGVLAATSAPFAQSRKATSLSTSLTCTRSVVDNRRGVVDPRASRGHAVAPQVGPVQVSTAANAVATSRAAAACKTFMLAVSRIDPFLGSAGV